MGINSRLDSFNKKLNHPVHIMNEQKLIKVLKQVTTLLNLQESKNKTQDILISNLNFQIKLIYDELNALKKLNLTKSERIT